MEGETLSSRGFDSKKLIQTLSGALSQALSALPNYPILRFDKAFSGVARNGGARGSIRTLRQVTSDLNRKSCLWVGVETASMPSPPLRAILRFAPTQLLLFRK